MIESILLAVIAPVLINNVQGWLNWYINKRKKNEAFEWGKSIRTMLTSLVVGGFAYFGGLSPEEASARAAEYAVIIAFVSQALESVVVKRLHL